MSGSSMDRVPRLMAKGRGSMSNTTSPSLFLSYTLERAINMHMLYTVFDFLGQGVMTCTTLVVFGASARIQKEVTSTCIVQRFQHVEVRHHISEEMEVSGHRGIVLDINKFCNGVQHLSGFAIDGWRG